MAEDSQAPAASRGIKRFYEDVTVRESEHGVGWEIWLDSRRLKSPSKADLVVESKDMALLLGMEWDAQSDKIYPSGMPIMSFVSTVSDTFPAARGKTIEECLRYLATDTVCFRCAEDDDKDLFEAQKEHWDPLYEWFESKYGIELGVSYTFVRPRHSEASKQAIENTLKEMNDWELQAAYICASSCKSLVVALALLEGQIDIDAAIQAARVEEEVQIKQWGMVEGGHDVDRAHLHVQVASASVVASAMKGDSVSE